MSSPDPHFRSLPRLVGGRMLTAAAAVLVAFASSLLAEEDTFTEKIVPFFESYCYDCHDGDTIDPKGDFNIFPFYTTGDALKDRKAMLHVRNVLHFNEMPPHDEKDRPSEEEKEFVMNFLEEQILLTPSLGDLHDPGPPKVRRMTRLEYNNTVRDLLGMESDLIIFSERLMTRRDYFDPGAEKKPDQLDIRIPEYGSRMPTLLKIASLPGDNRAAHGFYNQGDMLDITPLLIKRYLGIASEIVEHEDLLLEAPRMASFFGVEPPAPRTVSQPNRDEVGTFIAKVAREFAPVDNIDANAPGSSDQAWLFRDHIASAYDTGEGGVFQNPEDVGARVAGKGGEIRAEFGRNREKALLINPTEDLWFVDFSTAHETSPPSNIANGNEDQKSFRLGLKLDGVLEDEGILNLGVVVLSRSKQSSGPVTLTAHFSSGESSSLTDEIATGAGEDNTFFSWYAPSGESIVGLSVDGSKFSGDYVLLDDLGFITGKVQAVEEKAPPAEPGLTAKPEAAGESDQDSSEDGIPAFEEELEKFVSRAFRRPATEEDLVPFLALYEARMEDGDTRREAAGEVMRAVLTSPKFLLISEKKHDPEAGPVRPLTGHELATRLSYFLWASTPDEELLSVADQLTDPEVLEKQVHRMLDDPKSKELSDSFAYQWMKLNVLVGAQPDPRRNPEYYDGPKGKRTMAAPLLQEALLLFETVLIENRPLFDLIDPGFTWMNPDLIQYYGLEDHFQEELKDAEDIDKNGRKRLDNSKWYKCELPDRRRGGILTMGATLTLNSLPLRTSPVYRGAWVTEVVLNRPPPPPPAMVDELGADDQEMQEAGLTLRKKLEMHRNKADCAGCHTRIDPLGFPLENYDAIGLWRESYGKFPVDASGTLHGKYDYTDVIGFKDALAQRKEDFHRGFVRHLLTYALGRHLEAYDEKTIVELTEFAGESGLRDLIVEITGSYPFTHVRNE